MAGISARVWQIEAVIIRQITDRRRASKNICAIATNYTKFVDRYGVKR